jgi:ubiquinone/menaquinone biosynthesis C-methylase UbiE
MRNLFALRAVAAAVDTAYQGRLLHALLDGDATASDYAERLGLDPEATELILDVLSEFGFAIRKRGRYVASPSLTEAESLFGIDMAFLFWDRAPAFLLHGERPGRMDASADQREMAYADLVINLGRAYTEGARELTEQLNGDPMHILDVGAGSGVWSLAMVRGRPQTRVTALDFPKVLKAFQAFAAQLGLSAQTATLAGDAHTVDIPAGQFDRIIVANVLHLEPPERAAALLRRLAAPLVSGGEIVIVDAARGDTASSRRIFATYLLSRALRTGGGKPHSTYLIKRWLVQAGLTPALELQLSRPPHLRAVVARKPR